MRPYGRAADAEIVEDLGVAESAADQAQDPQLPTREPIRSGHLPPTALCQQFRELHNASTTELRAIPSEFDVAADQSCWALSSQRLISVRSGGIGDASLLPDGFLKRNGQVGSALKLVASIHLDMTAQPVAGLARRTGDAIACSVVDPKSPISWGPLWRLPQAVPSLSSSLPPVRVILRRETSCGP